MALRREVMVRRFWMNRRLRRWIFAWAGASVLGVINGATRELAYKDQVGEATANRISVVSLITLLSVYFWLLERRWPLDTTRDAFSIGAIWVALTIVFEFGFGHYVDGDSWEDLVNNYDVTEGNLWILILLWIGVGPATLRALNATQSVNSASLNY